MNKRIVSIALSGIFLALVASPVLAQSWYHGNVLGSMDEAGDNTTVVKVRETKPTLRSNDFDELVEQRDQSKEDRQAKIDEMKALKKEERCAKVEDNIQKRADYYTNSHSTHLNRYQGVLRNLQNASTRLSRLGYDTTALDAKIAEIEVLVAELNAMHDELTANMVTAKNKACDEDAGEFKTELRSSLSGLKDLKSKLTEISKSLKEEIVDILLEMKAAGVKRDEKVKDNDDSSDQETEDEETVEVEEVEAAEAEEVEAVENEETE